MKPADTILRAAWIAPIDSPTIRDGAVAVRDGRIVAVGPTKKIRGFNSDAVVTDLGDVILLPGLINAHTHLELSQFRHDNSPAGSFTDWILTIPKRRSDQGPEAGVREGIRQSLRFGVTCIGDITQESESARRVLSGSPLRCVSYGETLGLGGLRPKFDTLLARSIDTTFASPSLQIGLSPHAPYTVDLPGYKQCLKLARERSLPLATHLAENPDERAFLESHSGSFRQLWDSIGTWSEDVKTFRGSPIEMAHAIGLLDYSTLLAHVNYCDDTELNLLAGGRASVVYCPRTHRYFGHPPHRWLDMLAGGINLAIGTDSCASSPDLNLVDELRLLHQIVPEVPANTLWELVTIRAARALQLDEEIGSLTPGKRADFVTFHATSDSPLDDVLQSDQLPTAVWIDGSPIG